MHNAEKKRQLSKRDFLITLFIAVGVLLTAWPIADHFVRKANDQKALVVLQSLAVAMEAYYLKESRYPSDILEVSDLGYMPNRRVTVSNPVPGGTQNLNSSWSAQAWHEHGSKTWVWDSSKKNGGL